MTELKVLSPEQIDAVWNDLANGPKCGDCRDALVQAQLASCQAEHDAEVKALKDFANERLEANKKFYESRLAQRDEKIASLEKQLADFQAGQWWG
mgnify:CR=1 FL=1